MKKILSFMLVLCLCLGLLPNIQAKADIVTVDSIQIYAKKPVAGESPDISQVQGIDSYKSYYNLQEIKWMDSGYNVLSSSDTFEPLKTYYLGFKVVINKSTDHLKNPLTVNHEGNGSANVFGYGKTAGMNLECCYVRIPYYTDYHVTTPYTSYMDVPLPVINGDLYLEEGDSFPKASDFTSDDPSIFKVTGVKWYPKGKPSQVVGSTAKVAGGMEYTAELTIEITGTSTQAQHTYFSNETEFEVGGFAATTKSVSAKKIVVTVDTGEVVLYQVKALNVAGIQEPAAGATPQTSGVTTSTPGMEVHNISWNGTFDAQGKFKSGEKYTLSIEIGTQNGYSMDHLTAANCTVNKGTVKQIEMRETGYPRLQVELTVSGKKEVNNLGTYTIDLSSNNYDFDEDATKTKAFDDTLKQLLAQGIIKSVSGSLDLNKDGVADVSYKALYGTIIRYSIMDGRTAGGTLTFEMNTAGYTALQNAGAPNYYSKVIFKLPAMPSSATDLGKLEINLASGQFTMTDSAKWKALEATLKALGAGTQMNEYAGDPYGLDINLDNKSDVVYYQNGSSFVVDLSSKGNLGGDYSYTLNKTDEMAVKNAGASAYYSTVVFKFTPRPAAVPNVKAVNDGKNRVRLTWDIVGDAEGYLVYGQKNGKYGYVGMVGAGNRNFFVDTKAIGTDYNFYWVFPYVKNYKGNMVTGGFVKYVFAKGVTKAVTNLKAASAKGSVKLSWTASEGADGYLVYGIRPGGSYSYLGMTTKGTTFNDTKASKTAWTFYWVFPYHNEGGKMCVGSAPKYVYGKAQ